MRNSTPELRFSLHQESISGAAFDNGFGIHWFVVAFYYLERLSSDRQNGEADYLARVIDRDKKGKPRERWALGGECPALIASLKRMTMLETPTLNVLPGHILSGAQVERQEKRGVRSTSRWKTSPPLPGLESG